jgi:hypothetical protein
LIYLALPNIDARTLQKSAFTGERSRKRGLSFDSEEDHRLALGSYSTRHPPSVTRGARPHTKARGGSSEVPQPHHRDSPHPHSSSPCVSSPSPSSLRSSASPPHPRRPNSCRRLRAARARTPPPARARSPAATALEHIVSAHHRQLTSRGSHSCRSKGRRRRSNLWALC